MQRVLIPFIVVFIVSCSAPKEIIKSKDITPNCQCEGNGDYTIVLDAGMGNWSLFYQAVFHELKMNTRVCVIDRAGYAMNEVSVNSRDAKTIAFELNEALEQNKISNNLILVGHSLAGLHMRMFQSIFPYKVKAIVLIESAHPDQFDRLPEEFSNLRDIQLKSLDKVLELAQKDYLKYSKSKIPTYGIPDSLLVDYYQITTSPEYYYTMKSEAIAFENSLNQVKQLNDLGNLPLLVIGSRNSMDEGILPGNIKNYPFVEHNKIWFELQKELSQLSTNSTFVESTENHYMHLSDSKQIAEQIIKFISNNFSNK